MLSAAIAAQESRRDLAAQPGPAPFERILYLQGPGLRDAAAAERVRELGFTSVMTGSWTQAKLATAARLGVVLDQIVGKGILEVRDPQWLAVQRAYDEARDPETLQRSAVLSDPRTLVALCAAADAKLAEFAGITPWAISLGDEVSVTKHRNPLDLCFAPATLAAFRAELRRRHGDVDTLNLAWGTTFPSFEHVRPFTADEIRKRELGNGLPRNLAPWSEHRAFMDRELARVVAALGAHVRERSGVALTGLFGMQPPAAYGGHDLRLLLPGQSAFEVYDEGAAIPLARSLAPSGARLYLTIGPGVDEGAAEQVLGKVGAALAGGLAGIVVWSSELVLDDTGKVTGFGNALQAAFTRFAPVLGRAGAREVENSVWIVESQSSVRAWWMLDSATDGKTWIRRLSSYESSHSTSLAAREGWWKILADLGCQPEFVAAEDLERAVAERSRPRLLILPAQIALPDPALRAIAELAAKGTVIAADHEPALYDADLRLRAPPGLDAKFGIERVPPERARGPREGKSIPALRTPTGACAAEPELRALRALCDKAAGTSVQNERLDPGGIWCYLNLAVCEYSRVRLDPERVDTARDLRRRVQRILELANVVPAWPLRAAGLPTCLERCVLRGPRGERTLVVRVDALGSSTILRELARRGAASVEIFEPQEWRGQDLLGGASAAALRSGLDGGTEQVGKALNFPLDVWAGLFVGLPALK